MKFTPFNLSVILAVQIGVPVVYAASEQLSCDEHALNKLLRADKPEPLQKFVSRCGNTILDPRGFTIYDRARLMGSQTISAALVKQGSYRTGEYSKAMGKLIQTGLRFLNFDAGIIDGQLSERGIEAIKRYQKRYGFKEDGKLHDNWLADFYRRLVKKTQQELTDLGFDAGGADGIIGSNTMTAMQAFRQERQIPYADYGEVDDQLLYQLMMMGHEKHKKALAKRDAERAARRAAQEAARRKEVARTREEAQRQAEAQRRAAETAATAAREQRQVEEQRIRLLNIAAAQSAEEVKQATGQREIIQIMQQQQQEWTNISQYQTQQQAEVARRQAQLEAQAKAEQRRIAQEKAAAEQAAAEQKAREERARQAAIAAKAAEEQARREAEVAAQAAEQAKSEARKALNAAKHDKQVTLSREMTQATAIKGAQPIGNGFNELKGKLQFSNATSCTVSGNPIESSWCEAYYPSGNGKQCTVTMSRSGIVVSFLCK